MFDLSGKYDIIVADPPWRFKSNSEAKPGRNPRRHYPTMTLADIEAMPVRDIAAKDCLLFLWTTGPFAEHAMNVVKAWGFKYKTQLVWVKPNTITGFWAQFQHEPVYICTRGGFKCGWPPAPFPSSVISGSQREHSRKPDNLQNRINEVWPEARKIELFARQPRDGWDVWGNETTKFAGAA